jgi:hypothetical protein
VVRLSFVGAVVHNAGYIASSTTGEKAMSTLVTLGYQTPFFV